MTQQKLVIQGNKVLSQGKAIIKLEANNRMHNIEIDVDYMIYTRVKKLIITKLLKLKIIRYLCAL